MAEERRGIDKEMFIFIGAVTKHMENDATWKENYIKTKVENRVTKVETKVSFIGKSLYVVIAFVLTICSRLVYKAFHP